MKENELVMLNLTDKERESVLIALKRVVPANTQEDNAMVFSLQKLMKLSDAEPITLNNQEFTFTKNALDKLVKMFWELDACHDAVYKNAELALDRFAVPELNEATHIHIKLCNEIEPLTFEEIAAVMLVSAQYSEGCKRNTEYLDKLKPEYLKQINELLADLDTAKLELTKIIQIACQEDAEEGNTAFSIRSIRALLIVICPVIYNREPNQPGFGVSEDFIAVLTTASQKLEVFSGIVLDKIETFPDFSKLFKS